MHRCEELAELYGAYVYGATTEDETLRVLEHLRDCKTCRNDVKMRELTLTLIPNAAPRLSAEDRQFVAMSVKQRLAKKTARRPWWQVMTPAARSLSLAATVVIIFAGGAMFGVHMMQRPSDTSVPPPGAHNEIQRPVPPSIPQQTEQPEETDAPVATFSAPPASTSPIPRGSSTTSTSRRTSKRRIVSQSDWRIPILEQLGLVPVPDENTPDTGTDPLFPDELMGIGTIPQINKDAIPGTLERIWPLPEEADSK